MKRRGNLMEPKWKPKENGRRIRVSKEGREGKSRGVGIAPGRKARDAIIGRWKKAPTGGSAASVAQNGRCLSDPVLRTVRSS